MKTTDRFPLLFMALCFFYLHAATAQEQPYDENNRARNVSTTIVPGSEPIYDAMMIRFDIVPKDMNARFYDVKVILTYGNQEITANLNGNVGTGQTPGAGKLISWFFRRDFELTDYIDSVKVRVIALKQEDPKASFEIDLTDNNGFAPCSAKFTDKSEYCNSYSWNFGDVQSGDLNTSIIREPVHVYKQGGKYTITLVVSNTELNLKSTETMEIEIKEHPPVKANFSIVGYDEVKRKDVPINVAFENKSENATEYTWNFDDPGSGKSKNTSDELNPEHRYKNPGLYKIQLTARNSTSGLESVMEKELLLYGSASKPEKVPREPVIRPETPKAEKYKTMKTVWLASTVATAGIGGIMYLKANSLYNEYQIATEDPSDIRKKIQTYDKIYPVAFAAAVVSGVQVVLVSRKQSAEKTQLSLSTSPIPDGGMIKLTCNF